MNDCGLRTSSMRLAIAVLTACTIPATVGLRLSPIMIGRCSFHPTCVGEGASATPTTRAAVLASAEPPAALLGSLLEVASAAGPVGVDASPEDQAKVEELASALKGTGSEAAQARVPLAGEYELVYSASKGGSNGKVGPFVGKVTQIIRDESSFINQVVLWGGALTVQLHARRQVLDDERIRVDFVETVFQLFGREVSRRPTAGSGVWEQLYVQSAADGTAALRVMRTPSLFILRQRA